MKPVVARKRLIEVALPLDAINAASVREKSIRRGHPSTLHQWWARRPLAAAPSALFHLIGNTVFLRLSDVASGLPDYTEQVLLSSMDSEEDSTGYSQRSYRTTFS